MITLNVTLNINSELKKRLNVLLKNKGMDIENYMLSLVDKDINSKLEVNKNFYFDYDNNRLFYNSREITLSRMECKILRVLVDNQNTFISCEELEKIIKNTTKNSIRTVIVQIRAKTHRNIIKTVSKKGYKLSINDNSSPT